MASSLSQSVEIQMQSMRSAELSMQVPTLPMHMAFLGLPMPWADAQSKPSSASIVAYD